jgi:DNA-binding LytR/AlgR family response regulator
MEGRPVGHTLRFTFCSPQRMPTALIADDDEALRTRLARALRSAWPALQVLHECGNGADAWDAFLEHEPQICFLDVRMPGLTGIEVAQRIGTRAHVVFVTALGDPARIAFEAGGIGHVCKPIDAEQLRAAVACVQAQLAAPGAAPADLQPLLNELAGQVRRAAPLEVIRVGIGSELRPVRLDDVVYFESDASSTRVVCEPEGGDVQGLIRAPLKELLAGLDAARFCQVHRSVVVNRRHIAGAVREGNGTLMLTLHGRSERLPVSHHFEGLFGGR